MFDTLCLILAALLGWSKMVARVRMVGQVCLTTEIDMWSWCY